MNTTYTTEDTLKSLRDAVESGSFWEGFGSVYLDNARLPGQTSTQFRAHLSALARRGDYKPMDEKWFGAVRLA